MLDLQHTIRDSGSVLGLVLIGAIIFSESGLLIGFFLPGDTLLFSAGFFASQGVFPISALIIVVALAAFAGDNVGYEIGKRGGKRLFKKKDGILFRQDYITKAEAFYEKHGGKTIIMARYIPIVRTFAPVVAGIGNMPRKRFMFFDAIGCAVWGTAVSLLGFWLGKKIPNIDHYILPVIVIAMLLSFGPTIWHLFGEKETRRQLWAKIRRS